MDDLTPKQRRVFAFIRDGVSRSRRGSMPDPSTYRLRHHYVFEYDGENAHKTYVGQMVTTPRGESWLVANGKCRCPFFQLTGNCSHVEAVRLAREEGEGSP